MKLDEVKVNYNPEKYEQQITKNVKISKELKLNHWVTLKENDIIHFKQSFAGMKYPLSTASYELYINDKSGGGGTQNMLLNMDCVSTDDNAKTALENFFSTIEGEIF